VTDVNWVPEGIDQVIEPDGTIVDEKLDEGHHPEPEPKRIRVDVYHHFDGPIPLSLKLSGAFQVTVVEPTPTPPKSSGAVKAVLVVKVKGASPMALNVDDTTGDIVLTFEDDKDDVTGPPPGDGSGLVVTFASDNAAVCTLGAAVLSADGQSYSAPATPASEGSFNASAVVANTSGAALTDADGTTPFVQPTAVNVPVSAGQAASGSLAEVG
jgi:hypothetical protein